MVESKFSFFEVKVEGVAGDAVELGQSSFGVAPEGLDAVDVGLEVGELVVVMPDAEVLGVADVDQAVIASPAVAVNDAGQVDLAANRLQKRGFLGVGNDLRVDVAVAFEDAEDDRLAAGPATSLAAHALGAEVRFVDFHFSLKRGLLFTPFGDATPNFEINVVDPTHRETRQLSRVGRRQIQRERTQQPAKSRLADSGTTVVTILPWFHRTKSNSLRP